MNTQHTKTVKWTKNDTHEQLQALSELALHGIITSHMSWKLLQNRNTKTPTSIVPKQTAQIQI
jgi:hypothetical protein